MQDKMEKCNADCIQMVMDNNEITQDVPVTLLNKRQIQVVISDEQSGKYEFHEWRGLYLQFFEEILILRMASHSELIK